MNKNYEQVKAWRERNPDKVHEQYQRRKARDPERFKLLQRKAAAKYRAANMDKIRDRDREAQRKRRMKDPEGARRRQREFQERRNTQREVAAGRPRPDLCEVCNELHIRIVWDHDHETGEFRGWICDRCNRVLGLVYDNPHLLQQLSDYLKLSKYENELIGVE